MPCLPFLPPPGLFALLAPHSREVLIFLLVVVVGLLVGLVIYFARVLPSIRRTFPPEVQRRQIWLMHWVRGTLVGGFLLTLWVIWWEDALAVWLGAYNQLPLRECRPVVQEALKLYDQAHGQTYPIGILAVSLEVVSLVLAVLEWQMRRSYKIKPVRAG